MQHIVFIIIIQGTNYELWYLSEFDSSEVTLSFWLRQQTEQSKQNGKLLRFLISTYTYL